MLQWFLHFIMISISILQAFLADCNSEFDSTAPPTTSPPQVIKKKNLMLL